MAADELEFTDIKNAIATGRIRRKFKQDPRGVRYEIVGEAIDGREIGIICRIKVTGKLLYNGIYTIIF